MSSAVVQKRHEVRQLIPDLKLIEGGRSGERLHSHSHLFWIGSLIVLLQVLDGILTATGVIVYGIHAEGNPLLRSLMNCIGCIPAIVVTKAICVGFTVYLCSQAEGIRWLPLALRCVAVLYTIMAIVPWTLILASEYLS